MTDLTPIVIGAAVGCVLIILGGAIAAQIQRATPWQEFNELPFAPKPITYRVGCVRVTRHACPMYAELLAVLLLPLAVLIDNCAAPTEEPSMITAIHVRLDGDYLKADVSMGDGPRESLPHVGTLRLTPSQLAALRTTLLYGDFGAKDGGAPLSLTWDDNIRELVMAAQVSA